MGRRLEALDSLRGIAAALVVAFHLLPSDAATQVGFIGHAPVVLFFVLSGFVLAIPWTEGRSPPAARFILRRAVRLWPTAAAAMATCWGLYLAIGSGPPYVMPSWLAPMTPGTMLRCLTLSGCNELDPPLWSLVVEARISILFPLLVFLTSRVRPAVLLVALTVILGLQLVMAYGQPTWWAPSAYEGLSAGITSTLQYAPLFALGILLSFNLPELLAPGAGPTFSILERVRPATVALLLALPSDVANGFGAVLLIVSALTSRRLRACLLWPPFRWLGRVSYSLYVIHWPVILAVAYGLGRPMSPLQIAAAVVLSGLASEILYRLIEAPSIRISKALSMR